jgi:beta-N-acetylhexosaminidase
MVNLKEKPFYLNEEQIEWVSTTLEKMTLEEKCGQLFCEVVWGEESKHADRIFEHMQPGGVMFRDLQAEAVHRLTNRCQSRSRVPLLVAANLERGGNGIAKEGTYFASPMACAATDDEQQAYHLGIVACKEAAALGVNWTFEPILDINRNYMSSITNTRTFGDNPERIIKMGKAYSKGAREAGCAVSIKHFPGDGIDYRDQHLLTSVNSLSVEEWENSFGKVYRALIEDGAETLMAAHIKLPAYSKYLNPELEDADILPASLSKELLQELLREKMNFNGVIVSDATQMVGFTAVMDRKEAVPACIAAGVDMFLFTINQEEDMGYMLQGIEDGRITAQRLDEAVTRILALKAALKLPEKKKVGRYTQDFAAAKALLRCQQHQEWARECADKAVTLVKNTENLIPLSPVRHKRILFRVITLAQKVENDYDDNSRIFRKMMEKKGFELIDFQTDSLPGGLINEAKLCEMREKYDLILYFVTCDVKSNQKDIRIGWSSFLGGDTPKFVKEIPTVFISMSNPYHLADVPMISTYINAYSPCEFAVEAVVEKLTGQSPFKGISPVDAFCGLWDTRL